MNGNWTNFLLNKIHPMELSLKLPLLFPNLDILTLEYFTGEQLLGFVNKLKGLLKLVKLDIKHLLDRRLDELLKQVLSTNNCRLRCITFDQDSIFLPLSLTDKTSLYSNIEELTVNLIDCDMMGDLFALIPNVRRLYINLGASPFLSIKSIT